MKQGKVKSYRYGMKGEFTPNNHPKEGLFACLEGEVLEEHDEIFSGYNSVLFYSRRLTDEEKAKYKLEEIEYGGWGFYEQRIVAFRALPAITLKRY